MKKLENKVAVITGASKGIGASIAKHLASEGAKVVVNYASSKNDAEKVVADIKKEGGDAIAVQANVAKQSDIDKLFAETNTAFGKVDILVNNAGVYQFGSLEQVDEAHYHSQFDLNVLGLLLASKKAAGQFGEDGGSIINISSIVGDSPVAGASVYSATKAAVDAITKSLSKELGARKIRVYSLAPGMIETEGTHTAGFIGSDFHKSIESQTPLGRIGQPNDIGKVAAFLASDDAAWITGDVLVASGGMR